MCMFVIVLRDESCIAFNSWILTLCWCAPYLRWCLTIPSKRIYANNLLYKYGHTIFVSHERWERQMKTFRMTKMICVLVHQQSVKNFSMMMMTNAKVATQTIYQFITIAWEFKYFRCNFRKLVSELCSSSSSSNNNESKVWLRLSFIGIRFWGECSRVQQNFIIILAN